MSQEDFTGRWRGCAADHTGVADGMVGGGTAGVSSAVHQRSAGGQPIAPLLQTLATLQDSPEGGAALSGLTPPLSDLLGPSQGLIVDGADDLLLALPTPNEIYFANNTAHCSGKQGKSVALKLLLFVLCRWLLLAAGELCATNLLIKRK